ncbi:hypothetical protein F511_14931 [Dorcoceras hygrometricum]|uniref:Uncharacterized protein n=1 Tax=Dorcoceras hygrometricum TaxID=472368 RepID=A0A2Z7BK65_9LAMI|nr:hypothetical protein F511_14931 [Dorcoceras hygrometricum]
MLGTETNTSRTLLPEPELNSVGKSQEPTHVVPQLLSLSGLYSTPNWYKNVGLEEGFPIEVTNSLHQNRSWFIPKTHQQTSKLVPAYTGLGTVYLNQLVTKLIPINPNSHAVASLLITHQSALTISAYNHASK